MARITVEDCLEQIPIGLLSNACSSLPCSRAGAKI